MVAPKKKAPKVDQLVAEGRRWRRVETPRPWKPKEAGDSLTGVFVGWQTRRGREDTTYQIALIMTEEDGVKQLRNVSGTVIQTLFQASCITPEDKKVVRIVFRGWRNSADAQRTYKDFDLYIAEELVKRP
jgi:hypothetical protein